jgi:glycosyltransferase involved in cell wall biosynthesis
MSGAVANLRSASEAARSTSRDSEGSGHSGTAGDQLPFVSVVTPFYNTAGGLERCIQSVLAQSHRNFEYILADNRSDDGSGEIARAYANRDERVRYMRFDEHLPQTPNYNRALRQMSPDARYCKVVQADDFIFEPCLEEMLRIAMRYPGVGVIGATRQVGDELEPGSTELLGEFAAGRDVCRATLRGELYAFGSPTSVMYRADLVRARRQFYNPKAVFDDTDAVFDLLSESDFGFCRQLLTYTSRDPDSFLGRLADKDFGILYQYMTAHRIGGLFFSAQEAAELQRALSRTYYEQLIRSLLWRSGRSEYLSFHRAVLEDTAAMRLSFAEAARAFARLGAAAVGRRLQWGGG